MTKKAEKTEPEKALSSIATGFPPPADLPIGEIQYLLAYLSGQPFSRQQTIHAIGVIILYANSKIPDGSQVPGEALPSEVQPPPLTEHLKNLLPPEKGQEKFSIPPMFAALLKQLFALLLDKFSS